MTSPGLTATPRIFQSTPSARRATQRGGHRWIDTFYFNPRPPRGGRQLVRHRLASYCQISIHALREEGDLSPSRIGCKSNGFQSTPSARRATEQVKVIFDLKEISIHALREEGDPGGPVYVVKLIDFNPRPPRGGRPLQLDFT